VGTTPAFVTPMAAQVVKALPEGDEWLYEVKWDGYRALLIKDGRQVQVRSRNDKNLTRMYPTVAAAGLRLKAEQIVLDGEIVALGPDGRPSFQALQHRGSHTKHEIVFYAFDVLSLNGRDLTADPLTKRREQLPKIITADSVVRLSQDLPGSVADIIKTLRAAGVEGVIAKRKESPYQPGERSGDWVKFKLERQQEFVIGGYSPDGVNSLDAVLVGYYEATPYSSPARCVRGWCPSCAVRCSRSSNLCEFRSVLLPTCQTRAPGDGGAASPPRKWRRCSGQSPRSSHRSASLNGQPTTACVMRLSWACALIRQPGKFSASRRER
jgi:bifunctional non-homologous end joining protein LigD